MQFRTDQAIVRDWLKALGSVVASGLSASEAGAKLAAMVPWAAADFGPECFTPATLKSAARDFKFFPAYAELAAHLRHFQRDETPRIGYEIPQPRRAPTAEEVEHVAATLRAFQAERSFSKPASAPAKAAVKPAHLSPGALLAAYEAQKRAGATGLDVRIAGLRRQMGLDSGAGVGAVLSDPRGVMAGAG